jgi:hypothetical protein
MGAYEDAAAVAESAPPDSPANAVNVGGRTFWIIGFCHDAFTALAGESGGVHSPANAVNTKKA